MAKLRHEKPNYRVTLYRFKQAMLRAAYGYLPPELRQLAMQVLDEQTARWNAVFGRFNTAWNNIVVPILKENGVPRLYWAAYRAFMNRFISKVLIKNTQTEDEVINDFVAKFGLDENVLRQIVDALKREQGFFTA